MIESVIFYFLSTITIVPAIFVVTMKNVFHSALWLIVSLLGVGGMYALLAADFLFAVQLMVYAGGVMVLMLFVVLLSGKPTDWQGSQINDKWWGAVLFSAFFIAIVSAVVASWPLANRKIEPTVTTGALGKLLLGDMILPFEVIAVVLVVALIGAVYFSQKRKPS